MRAAFDIYNKGIEGSQQRSVVGAVVTIGSALVMFLLFISELRTYLTTDVKNRLFVDPSRNSGYINVNFDISFPALPCGDVHLDLEDSKGVKAVNVDQRQTITKTPLLPEDASAAAAAAAAGASAPPSAPANAEGGEAKKKEPSGGCNLKGTLNVSKVAGDFHITLGKNRMQGDHIQYSFSLKEAMTFNSSHVINHLSFGEVFPGMVNTLDETSMVNTGEDDGSDGRDPARDGKARRPALMGVVNGHLERLPDLKACQFKYYLKVVPSIYHHLDGRRVQSNQFSHTAHRLPIDLARGKFVHPGVFFKYDFHPLVIESTETRPSFFSFVTRLCAILGGVYTVAGMFTSVTASTAEVLLSDKKTG